jgi:hypothetical protein
MLTVPSAAPAEPPAHPGAGLVQCCMLAGVWLTLQSVGGLAYCTAHMCNQVVGDKHRKHAAAALAKLGPCVEVDLDRCRQETIIGAACNPLSFIHLLSCHCRLPLCS